MSTRTPPVATALISLLIVLLTGRVWPDERVIVCDPDVSLDQQDERCVDYFPEGEAP